MGGVFGRSQPPQEIKRPPLEQPWRQIRRGQKWNQEMEMALREECLRDYSELLGGRQVRILVLGATGSGKSSFIKSLYCALTDEVRQYTHAAYGTSGKTVTKTLYHPLLPIEGKTPYFRVLDAPGIIEEKEEFYHDFVTFALQGHLREGVEIPPGRIQRDADHYVESPGTLDRPCLVVFVLGPRPLMEGSVLKKKLDIAMEEAGRNKIKLAIVLTKADLYSEPEEKVLRDADVKFMFRSQASKEAVEKASRDTGVPRNLIFPVTNYVEQTETCTEMNIVLLYTLSKLLSDARLEAETRLKDERAARQSFEGQGPGLS